MSAVLVNPLSAPLPLQDRPAAPLPGPSDWSFELIEQYHKVIRDTAERFGLDTYPNQLEIITAELLKQKLLGKGGRVIGISSIAGIAGNNGQTSYGTAKAGVIGFVNDLSKRVAKDGITVNAIAPGFIETDMVKTMPLGIREAGRRLSSVSQGGLPIDVAEAIACYANPGSSATTSPACRAATCCRPA